MGEDSQPLALLKDSAAILEALTPDTPKLRSTTEESQEKLFGIAADIERMTESEKHIAVRVEYKRGDASAQ